MKSRFEFDEIRDFMNGLLKPKPDGPKPMNFGLLLSESLRFSKDPEPGLEMVDILANATRRALRGNLQREGWQEIPTIMIARNPTTIQLLSLDSNVPQSMKVPYGKTVMAFHNAAKPMLTERNRKAKW